MKILHVLAQLPLKTGSGVYFTNVVEGLKNYNDIEQAAIYATTDEYNINIVEHTYPVYFEKDIPFPIVGMSDVMPYKNTLYKNMTDEMFSIWKAEFKKQLLAAKEQFQPDIIITHHLWILSSLVCEIFNDKKIIGICHNTDIRQAEQNPNIFKEHVTKLNKLDKILALSSKQIDDISTIYNYPKEHILDMGAGYNDKVFYPKKSYEISDQINLVYAGKFDESKGFYELIKAFKILETMRNDVSLDLIGTIKEENRSLIKNLLIDAKNINIYNVRDQKHLGEVMREKDIFVLPSYFEGLGLIAVEALGSGLRVVATEIDGLMELLGEKINNSEIIDYVEMPTIYDTDKAVEEEKPAFVERLVNSLNSMIDITKNQRKLPENLVKEIETHSWKAKIEEIYNLL